jgi:hypothetical protein
MATFQTFVVEEILSARKGIQRLRLDDGSRAYNLTNLTGPVAVADRVVANTTAVQRGLGTGGWHVVHWNLSRATLETPSAGHIMKMRYTSLQADTGSFEEHMTGEVEPNLHGTPVVVCSLHSQMAAAAVAFAAIAPHSRLVYVMTDGASLPIAMSDIVAELRSQSILAATVTSGHAFGGDSEAVNIASALLAAKHVHHADAIIVSMGPGVVGTGTALGTTALETVDIAMWAYRLGARVVFALRGSTGDPRERHQGISHHSRTALEYLRLSGVLATVPVSSVDQHLAVPLSPTQEIDVEHVMGSYESADAPRITSMGRDVRADPRFFRLSAAAGIAAAHMLQIL